MKIAGFDKLSLLNYPGVVACTIFTRGCNFKCPYCQNSELIDFDGECIDEKEIFDYLEKRKGVIDGVCISGGEPLLQKDIKDFIIKIKEMGYKVKLDTNGSNPVLLKELLDNRLVDYVAMDLKNIYTKYDISSGIKTRVENIKKSVDILQATRVQHEFRTTIAKEMHNINDIKRMRNYLGHRENYYVQNFENSENVLNKNLHSFSKEELKDMKKSTNDIYFRDI